MLADFLFTRYLACLQIVLFNNKFLQGRRAIFAAVLRFIENTRLIDSHIENIFFNSSCLPEIPETFLFMYSY